MKKVLFIGVSFYDFKRPEKVAYLKGKFEGLAQGARVFVLARGKPFYKKIWGAEFYLLPNRLLYWLFAWKLCFWLCLIKGIDTLIAQSPLLEGLIGAFLKKILRRELIVEMHGDWQEGPFLSKKRRLGFVQKKFVSGLVKISLRTADKIRGVAKYLVEKAKEIVPDKPYFIFPTFTDLDIFLDEKDACFNDFILFVGQLEKVKGVDYLLRAFEKIMDYNQTPRLIKFNQPRSLIIVGEGSEREGLENLVKILNLEDRVSFKGQLSLEKTKDIMKKCYCLVLPSLSEGLPRVVLEAMALGKPVVGCRIGGIPELIKDGQNGFLFEKGNSKGLAKKLKILLANKNLALEMGRNGREFVKKRFSNEQYINNYLRMIKL